MGPINPGSQKHRNGKDRNYGRGKWSSSSPDYTLPPAMLHHRKPGCSAPSQCFCRRCSKGTFRAVRTVQLHVCSPAHLLQLSLSLSQNQNIGVISLPMRTYMYVLGYTQTSNFKALMQICMGLCFCLKDIPAQPAPP